MPLKRYVKPIAKNEKKLPPPPAPRIPEPPAIVGGKTKKKGKKPDSTKVGLPNANA